MSVISGIDKQPLDAQKVIAEDNINKKVLYSSDDFGPYVVYIEASENLKKIDIRLVKNKGSNRLAVEFTNFVSANNFLNNKRLVDKGYNLFIPYNFVTCKGVVRRVDLEFSEEVLMSNCRSNATILNIKRISRKNISNDSVDFIPTGTIIVTFRVVFIARINTNRSKSCPEFLRQLEIKKLMAFENLTYYDASNSVKKNYVSKGDMIFNSNDFPKILSNKPNNINHDQRITPNQRRNEHCSNNKTKRSFAQVTNNTSPKKRIILKSYNNKAINDCLLYPNGRPSTSKDSPIMSPISYIPSSIENDPVVEPSCAEFNNNNYSQDYNVLPQEALMEHLENILHLLPNVSKNKKSMIYRILNNTSPPYNDNYKYRDLDDPDEMDFY
ncbi:hypothetical protein ABEB36_014527 [Hypothenemus hampei]|uniref:Uncharacterized protein n=1 Tax=Hypothenemus hampei TaxID=57062 RepID=A0ABD1E2C2_HYPHA